MSKEKKNCVPVSFRMDIATRNRLHAYADKLGQNYTVCIERIINAYLDELEASEKSKP